MQNGNIQDDQLHSSLDTNAAKARLSDKKGLFDAKLFANKGMFKISLSKITTLTAVFIRWNNDNGFVNFYTIDGVHDRNNNITVCRSFISTLKPAKNCSNYNLSKRQQQQKIDTQ